jgi:hypothetical protein
MQNPEEVILLASGLCGCWPEAQQRQGVGLRNANSGGDSTLRQWGPVRVILSEDLSQ